MPKKPLAKENQREFGGEVNATRSFEHAEISSVFTVAQTEPPTPTPPRQTEPA